MAATEEFANVPSTTVSSGGTDAPVSGTTETWTVANSSGFPAASTGVTQFHVADPDADSEIIAVTNVSGTTWTVTRGAESTTPVSHTSGFTIVQVVTAGFLNSVMASAFLRTPVIVNPASRTTYTATGGTFTAFGSGTLCTGSFIAPASGDVVVSAGFVASISGNASMAFALAASGAVSPLVCDYVQFRDSASTAQNRYYNVDFWVTSLTPGSSYNFDLLGAAGTFTATIAATGSTSVTPGLTAATDGAPVVITVQQV